MNEFEKTVLSSDLINFFLFACLIGYLVGKFLPKLVGQRNDEIRSEIAKAAERYRLAQEQLDLAERELEAFKREFEQVQAESEHRLKLLKQELGLESERKIQSLKLRYEKEIANMRQNIKIQCEREIALEALRLTELRLTSSTESPALIEFSQNSLREIFLQAKPSTN